MTTDALLAWLLNGAVATSAALLLVLALRLPLRRAFGARIAYLVWALVPLALAAVTLPAPRVTTALFQALPALRPAVAVGTPVLLDADAGPGAAMIDWPLLLAFAWCLGALLLALRLAGQQRRFVAGLGRLRPRDDGTFVADAEQCPVVIGAWRPRIVLPADFELRYPAAQAALVVAHERAHVRRGDVHANLAAAVLRCVHWFNPLLHFAATRFRLDQELACDAAVLAGNPHARRAYADAMLNTQLAVPGLPVGCHWQSSQSLKERILMLKKPQPGAWRRRSGAIALCAVLAGSSYAAWALRPASDATPVYRGVVAGDAIAMATVRIPDGMDVDVSGGSMAALRGGDTVNVMLEPGQDLVAKSGDARAPWLLRASATGTTSTPAVTWSLERNGRVERETTLGVGAAPAAVDLSMLADARGRVPSLAFSRLPATGIIEADTYGGSRGGGLRRETDGAYREGDPIHAASRDYKGDGTATLLVGVGADGRVQTVEIENMSPAGALTGAEIDELVRRNVYVPEIVDGKRVPTRVRVPVQFARTTSSSTGTPAPDAARPGDLVPPKYPAEAVKKKISGQVVLLVDIAADGSVRHAEIESSKPAGVFDQAALDAAKAWTFNPKIEDGKPVAGRVRVPVTFNANGPEEPMKVPVGTNADPAAYDWIKYDSTVDKDIRTIMCDVIDADTQTNVAYCGRLKRTASAR